MVLGRHRRAASNLQAMLISRMERGDHAELIREVRSALVRRTVAAGWTAAAGVRFVHDRADRAGAATALGAAAEAAVDLRGGARSVGAHGTAHIVVAQDVAGTDDHSRGSNLCSEPQNWRCRYRRP